MRNLQTENVAMHSQQTAIIAYALGVIDNEVFGLTTNADKCATLAVFHEASEVLVGDMPTVVKYRNDDMIKAFKEAEKDAEKKLLSTLPDNLKKHFAAVMAPGECREVKLVKFADKIASYIKCIEEVTAGNNEFKNAKNVNEKVIKDYNDKTVNYFLDNFIDSFYFNLDELLNGNQ